MKNADGQAGQEVEPVAWWDGGIRLTRHKSLPVWHVWERVIPLYTHPAPSPEGHAAGPARSAPDEALIIKISQDTDKQWGRWFDDSIHLKFAVRWAIREYIRRDALLAEAASESRWANHYARRVGLLEAALQNLVSAYSEKHSPQHRKACLVEAMAVLRLSAGKEKGNG